MRNQILLCFVLFSSTISGCVNTEAEITENEAESIVEQYHAHPLGTVDILSIEHERNYYVVKWKNAGNCEWGTDLVDDENGEIRVVEAAIC